MGWCEPLCCVFPIINMDQLSLKQLCQCYELWTMTSRFNTSRVKRKDFAPSADSFSLCFNRTEINDVHPLWQTHRVTLRSFTKVLTELQSRVCFCGFHHPLPPWEVGAAPTPPHDAPSSGSVIWNERRVTSVTAVTLQASNKARSLWIRWKTQKSELIISHEGARCRNYVQPQPDLNPAMRGAYLCFLRLLLKPWDWRLIPCFHAATGFNTCHQKSAETAADRKIHHIQHLLPYFAG